MTNNITAQGEIVVKICCEYFYEFFKIGLVPFRAIVSLGWSRTFSCNSQFGFGLVPFRAIVSLDWSRTVSCNSQFGLVSYIFVQ